MSSGAVWWLSDLLAVIMVLFCFTFFFKRTILFRIAESTFVGVSIGVALSLSLQSINVLAITPIAAGDLILIIPMILGVAFIARFFRQIRTISRIPTAIVVGSGIAVTAFGQLRNILRQSTATMVPITTGDMVENVGELLIVVLTLATIYYFFWFAQSRTGSFSPVKQGIARIGRIAIMITLGVSFAGGIAGYVTAFADRILFILRFLGLAA